VEVNRIITWYERDGEKFVGEIYVNEIEQERLLELITVKEYKDDYLLYNCYQLDTIMLDALSKLAGKEINYDLDKYEYFLEAMGK
jgi:hypothetical protein